MDEPIFLMAGRTGGPLTPLLATSSQLPYKPIIVGVNHGYEKQIATSRKYLFLSLPETKLNILSFKTISARDVFDIPPQLFWLVFSFVSCIYYLLRYRPRAIFGAGGFTSVPMVIACRILRLLGLPTKIIIHQQDPLIGLSNKIALRLCDSGSYVYDYPPGNPILKDFEQLPNPIEFEVFHDKYQQQLLLGYPQLADFFEHKSNPVLLIFGGGSGAHIINQWVLDNHRDLLSNFDIIHLTGALQSKQLQPVDHPRYLRFEYLFEEMPLALKLSDVVLCRAGLGSISELIYTQKPAFLVPIEGSHQEVNAKVVEEYFEILTQNKLSDWFNIILEKYPHSFEQKQKMSSHEYQIQLLAYYERIEKFLEK